MAQRQAPAARPSRTNARKRQAANGSCAPIDIGYMQRCMSAETFALITAYANKTWGADWDNFYHNPPAEPDFGLSACVVAPQATLTLDAQPQCTTRAVNSSLVDAQTDGPVSIPYEGGESNVLTASVAHAAVMPVQTTVTSDVYIPALAGGLEPSNLSLTIENFLLSSASRHKSDLAPANLNVKALKGQACYAPLSNVSCSALGHTQIQIASSGYVWFNYSTLRGTPPNTQWAVSVDDVVTDVSSRSTYLQLNASAVSSRIATAGDPICEFASSGAPQSAQEPSSAGGRSTPAYVYAVPVAVVVALGCAGAFYFWHRSRISRTRLERQHQYEEDRASSVPPASLSLSGAQPLSSGKQNYRQWAGKLPTQDAGGSSRPHYPEKQPPAYSQVASTR